MNHIFCVVEDTTEQAMIKGLLAQSGFQVTLSSSVDEARDKLQNVSPPNLIVMAGKSCLELFRTIRESDKLQDIPIVFCGPQSEESWAMSQGAQAYLVKPYAPKALLDVVYQNAKR